MTYGPRWGKRRSLSSVDARKTCTKCGCSISEFDVGYCKSCKVRLGLLPFSAMPNVRPGAVDFWMKQLNEPIHREWLFSAGYYVDVNKLDRGIGND